MEALVFREMFAWFLGADHAVSTGRQLATARILEEATRLGALSSGGFWILQINALSTLRDGACGFVREDVGSEIAQASLLDLNLRLKHEEALRNAESRYSRRRSADKHTMHSRVSQD